MDTWSNWTPNDSLGICTSYEDEVLDEIFYCEAHDDQVWYTFYITHPFKSILFQAGDAIKHSN